MPIYEFFCNDCKKKCEILVLGSQIPKCPDCESEDLKRILSVCAFKSKDQSGNTTASSTSSACSSCNLSSCAGCTSS